LNVVATPSPRGQFRAPVPRKRPARQSRGSKSEAEDSSKFVCGTLTNDFSSLLHGFILINFLAYNCLIFFYAVASLEYLAPEDKNIFAPPSTVEVKNGRKSAEEAKPEHLLFVPSVIFRRNKIC